MLEDIKEIEIFLNRRNKLYIEQGIYFELVLWENSSIAFSSESISESFRKEILNCDVFILLLHSRLGGYTIEEFEQVFENYRNNNKPYIYVFFKNTPVSLEKLKLSEFERLKLFQKRLQEFGLFYNQYENIESLKLILSNQLDALDLSRKTSAKEKEPSKHRISIFISYNHKDSSNAIRIKDKLQESGFKVIIDSENMYPGADIDSFIKDSILNTDITLSIVSKNSLLSSWVGLESMESFNKEGRDSRRFLPVILEKTFFERKFTGDALESIDKEITEIIDILKVRLEKTTGFADLYGEFKRYLLLRNNIDEIVRRLRESLSVDVSEDNYETGMQKIVNYLIEFDKNNRKEKE